MSDDLSNFRVDLPSVLCAIGTPDRVQVWRSTEMHPEHPALEFVRWYVQRRGLVAMVIDHPHPDDRFHNGCLASVYVTASERRELLEESKTA